MQNDEIIVGLDIGTTKICVIVGRKNAYGKLEVLGMGKAPSEGVSMGMVSNIDKTVTSIRRAVEEAEEKSGIDIRVVNVGIAGQHIRSTTHRGSITCHDTDEEITIEDVNRLINDMYKIVTPAGNKIIHVMPQSYLIDSHKKTDDPVGVIGRKLEADFHVITAQSNAIHSLEKCVKRAGLEIDNLILEPLASSMAVLSDEEKEAGVCLVDIGGGTTDIAIFHENIIRHTAVIPFGGDIITNDIKQGCSLMQNQAEQLKTQFGIALEAQASANDIVSIPGLRNRPPKEISIKNLACIIESRMEEIIEFIHNEIIASGYDKNLTGGIVITGGGALLKSVGPLFEYMTAYTARSGYPNEHMGKSKEEEVKSPMYATSVGLVLAGFYALDKREDKYKERLKEGKSGNYAAKKSESGGKGFFKNIIDRTKGLLINDLDDKDDY
ncbi:MAG: cell division protein FtsA [Cyclobacteriaceae bacterium]|nr:cell division protein FtsA [Cyclobacteriaceae bacterium]MCH8516248.1 cell division protein FtsA [Cyclobacteriaceae bacterium]